MKKLLISVGLLASLAFNMPALADNQIKVVFYDGRTDYYISDQQKALDAAPLTQDGRLYVPMRALGEALGATVEYNDGEVKLSKGQIEATFSVGSDTVKVNGQTRTMDVTPISIPPGRVMLPARYVAEAFLLHINWNQNANSVMIYNDEQKQYNQTVRNMNDRFLFATRHGNIVSVDGPDKLTIKITSSGDPSIPPGTVTTFTMNQFAAYQKGNSLLTGQKVDLRQYLKPGQPVDFYVEGGVIDNIHWEE